MKRTLSYATAVLMLATGLAVSLAGARGKRQEIRHHGAGSDEALNNMGTYLRSLKDFQVKAAVTSEDVLSDGEKLTFTHTTEILAQSPNKLRVEIEGDQKSRLFLYDGTTFTLFARRAGYYASVDAPPTIGELIDVVSDKYGIDIPLLDLFLWGGPVPLPMRSPRPPILDPAMLAELPASTTRIGSPASTGRSGSSLGIIRFPRSWS